MPEPATVTAAAIDIIETAAADDWRGPDPYDALVSTWPDWLVGGRRRRMLVIQLHARSPIDFRPLYRSQHPLVPKGLALFAAAGLRVAEVTGDPRARTLGLEALELLYEDRRAGEFVWGYPWQSQHRWAGSPASDPSIVPTAFAVAALLAGERATGRSELGERARAAARWVLDELWQPTAGYFAYHRHSTALIHNANLLGAWMVWTALGHEAQSQVEAAVGRTLADQQPDGSWPYGEGGQRVGWADSFHTGYVLTCLDRVREATPDADAAIARGASFYRRFFGASGEARLWANRGYPEDGHSAGTGLTTLAMLYARGLVDRGLLDRVADRVLTHGIRDGHAVFRRYRWGLRSTVHYPRWCDGHVALGLADAASALALAGTSSEALST